MSNPLAACAPDRDAKTAHSDPQLAAVLDRMGALLNRLRQVTSQSTEARMLLLGAEPVPAPDCPSETKEVPAGMIPNLLVGVGQMELQVSVLEAEIERIVGVVN